MLARVAAFWVGPSRGAPSRCLAPFPLDVSGTSHGQFRLSEGMALLAVANREGFELTGRGGASKRSLHELLRGKQRSVLRRFVFSSIV